MKIKLTRSGGFIAVRKIAETEVDFSEEEFGRLIETIRRDPSKPRIKDGNYYELSAGNTSSPVDLDNVPDEYKELISKLKDDLKLIK